jgi:hypothetical protein
MIGPNKNALGRPNKSVHVCLDEKRVRKYFKFATHWFSNFYGIDTCSNTPVVLHVYSNNTSNPLLIFFNNSNSLLKLKIIENIVTRFLE